MNRVLKEIQQHAELLPLAQQAELLVNVAKDLPSIEAFAHKDPLTLQKEMRDAGLNNAGQTMTGGDV
jgi:hypothetical protein